VRAAISAKGEKWDMFVPLDSVFEAIADDGDARLFQ